MLVGISVSSAQGSNFGFGIFCHNVAGPLPRYRDLYLLSNVIHDWDDARAITILRNCRKAMTADARLLVIEEIMPSRVADSPDTIANNFAMLLLTGGKERTAQEYRTLLDIAGHCVSANRLPRMICGRRHSSGCC